MSEPSPPLRNTVWRSIADSLQRDIERGRYPVGGKLPAEQALAERFGVNRHTVRHAMKKLIADGLVRTRRGAGAFVVAPATDYPLGRRVRFHENLLAAGRKPERTVTLIETRAASHGEANALDMDIGGAVCAYHGVSLADGQPVGLFESVFPAERLEGIDTALATVGGVTEALKCVGISDYTRASTRVNAVLADAAQALQLHVKPGDPLLRTSALNVDGAGRPIEFGRTWFAGSRVTLTVDADAV